MPRKNAIVEVDFTFATKMAGDLQTMTLREQTAVLRRGVSAASGLVVADARRRAPEDTGSLKKSMNKRVKTYLDGDLVLGIIGPDTRWYDDGSPIKREKGQTRGEYNDAHKKQGKKRPAWYAHNVEFGGPRNPVAKAFLRPAVDENVTQIKRELADAATEAMRKAFKKAFK